MLGPLLYLDRSCLLWVRRIDRRGLSLVAGLWLRGCCRWESGQGADREREWVICSLDTSPLGQLGLRVLPPLADTDRNSSPALAWTLFSVAWNGLHLQRCQEQVNHQAKYQQWLLFFPGHRADCQFSLRNDLLTSFILLCYTLSAERCINAIGMKSLHFAVK